VSHWLIQLLLWSAYFATDIYGHVQFKVLGSKSHDLFGIIFSLSGLSAIGAWAASALLWITILSGSKFLHASSVASLTYVLMVAVSVLLFRETVTTVQVIGIGLIISGVVLVTR